MPLTQLIILNYPVIEALAYLQTNFPRQHLRKFIEIDFYKYFAKAEIKTKWFVSFNCKIH